MSDAPYVPKAGDFVSDGRKKGIVTSVSTEEGARVDFHSGIRIRGYVREFSKLRQITEKEFVVYVAKHGYTSFYERIAKLRGSHG